MVLSISVCLTVTTHAALAASRYLSDPVAIHFLHHIITLLAAVISVYDVSSLWHVLKPYRVGHLVRQASATFSCRSAVLQGLHNTLLNLLVCSRLSVRCSRGVNVQNAHIQNVQFSQTLTPRWR